MLFSHQDLFDTTFVETYGITVPPKQRYLLKKVVINTDPNKHFQCEKDASFSSFVYPGYLFLRALYTTQIANG